MFVDSQSSPEKAVRAVQDAITREGVQFLANGWHSSVAMALTDAEAPYDIVHIGHLGESQYISEKINQSRKVSRLVQGLAGAAYAGLLRAATPALHGGRVVAAGQHEGSDPGRGYRFRPWLGRCHHQGLSQVGFEVLPYDDAARRDRIHAAAHQVQGAERLAGRHDLDRQRQRLQLRQQFSSRT